MPEPGFFLYNASAGSAASHPAEQLLDILRESGATVDLHEFCEGDVPHDLVKSAVARGARWVAVAGGDGTIENAATALLGTDVPLGIIPCGTYNNFALSTGTPADPCEACRRIAGGRTRSIDVGFLNGKPFFECVGVGLDAALFPLGEEIKSGGFLRWFEFLRRAYRYRRKRFEIEFDGPVGDALADSPRQNRHRIHHLRRIRRNSLHVQALLLTVSNGPYYGMNFTVAPEARMDDGRFTITLFKRFSKMALWWHFLSISFGRRLLSPELITFRSEKLTIRGPVALPYHLDGSPGKDWPLDLVLKRNFLSIFSV